MGELRVGAAVRGRDGELGEVDALVLDPVRDAVTHVVVAAPTGERSLLPLAAVTGATPDAVATDLDAEGFAALAPFDEPGYHAPAVAWQSADLSFEPGTFYLEPFASPAEGWSLEDHERIPLGEVVIRRGDAVHTAEGTEVGHVDELLVDPGDGAVTHLVLREGHLLGHDRDVVVPVAGATFDVGRVTLALDVAEVHALPHLPVRRHHHVVADRLPGRDDDGV